MSFQIIPLTRGGPHGSTVDTVKVCRLNNNNSSCLRFSLSDDLAVALKLEHGSTYEMLRGADGDEGYISIRRTDSLSARKIGRGGKTGPLIFTIAAAKLGVTPPPRTTRLPHSLRDDMLVIDIRSMMPADAMQAAA